jgi:hypothetical protein
MTQPRYLADAARLIRSRLDPNDPAFRASREVKKALEEIHPYLFSWVYPLVKALENGAAERWLKEDIAREMLYVKRADPPAKPDADPS